MMQIVEKLKKYVTKKELKKYLILLISNLFLGISYSGFVLRGNIMTGGLGGLAIFIEYFVKMDISIVFTILSGVLFFIGLIFKGKKFALKTLFSTITYPLAVVLCDIFFEKCPNILPNVIDSYGNVDTGLQLLYAVFCGVFTGIGLGLAFKVGGSTGGLDIPAVIIADKTKISIDKVVFGIDAVVIALGILPLGLINVVIGLIANVIYSFMIDKVIVGGQKAICVQIFSDKNEEIYRFVNDELERGATYLKALGAYKKEPREVLEVVIYRRQYSSLIDFIHSIDDKAFVIALDAKEVFGLGFKTYDKETIK